jgi:ribosomal protein S18 acetylase RimI-like enzyme
MNHDEITMRETVSEGDLAPIEKILRTSKFFRDDEIVVALELLLDGVRKGEKSEYKFIVAQRGGQVAGYCCFGSIPLSLHSWDLYWIAVDPNTQRGGIGRKLMAAAEARVAALGGRRLYVETSSKPLYEPTRKFYLSCNYEIAADLDEFYGPGDGKTIFVKVVGISEK